MIIVGMAIYMFYRAYKESFTQCLKLHEMGPSVRVGAQYWQDMLPRLPRTGRASCSDVQAQHATANTALP